MKNKRNDINFPSSYPYPKIEKKDNKTKHQIKRREEARRIAADASEFASFVMGIME